MPVNHTFIHNLIDFKMKTLFVFPICNTLPTSYGYRKAEFIIQAGTKEQKMINGLLIISKRIDAARYDKVL